MIFLKLQYFTTGSEMQKKTAKKNLCISQSIFENDSLLQQTKINHDFFSFPRFFFQKVLYSLSFAFKFDVENEYFGF